MTGQQILDLVKTRVGDPYILGSLVPKDNAAYHGPWDCAEFTSWLVYQVSNKLYGCYNDAGKPATADAYTGYWKNDSEKLGKIITIEEAKATPGAAILRCSSAEQKVGHIVISDGHGGTVEANSHKYGVMKSVVDGRRWDYGILVPWITYTHAAPAAYVAPTYTIFRLTQPMMVSAKVGEIQKALTHLGFSTYGIDNVFGHNTVRAVEAFQEDHDLVVDGEVGKDTAKALGIVL